VKHFGFSVHFFSVHDRVRSHNFVRTFYRAKLLADKVNIGSRCAKKNTRSKKWHLGLLNKVFGIFDFRPLVTGKVKKVFSFYYSITPGDWDKSTLWIVASYHAISTNRDKKH
jgi:hypothetical protein